MKISEAELPEAHATGVPSVTLAFDHVVQDFRTENGPLRVLDGIDFTIDRGHFTAIIGPSGCGKSTLLQMAAGLLFPTGGSVRHDGRAVRGVNRRVGFVPQQAQLLPWKTMRENIELPLVLRGVSSGERDDRVQAIIKAVGLAGFDGHYPHQLSGGMQKRASIARTLIYSPDVVLMDEPFGALDAQTRMVMQNDLQRLGAEQGSTIVFVTHDLTESILLADKVVVMSRRPARVKAVIAIDLPRPRNVFEPYRTPGFTELHERLWSIFQAELIPA